MNLRFLALLLGSLLWFGCASTGSIGDQLLSQGNHAEAILAYQADEAASPNDPRLKRNFGIALLEAGRLDEARTRLEAARRLEPENTKTIYFQARVADEAGELQAAIDFYGDYLSLTSDDAKWVRGRIQSLAIEKATDDVLNALSREHELALEGIPENTVAVPQFTNVAERDDLESLTRGLAAVLITDLSRVSDLRVVEREKMQVLLKELDLASTPVGEASTEEFEPIETTEGLQQRLQILLRPGTAVAYFDSPVDGRRSQAFIDAVKHFQEDQGLTVDGVPGPRTYSAVQQAMSESGVAPPAGGTPKSLVSRDTAPRAGKILGARQFIQGGFTALGESEVQLDAAILEVATGAQAPAGAPVSGELVDVLKMEKRLVYQVLDTMGIEPTDAQRKQIDRLQTESFLAFAAYSRGLHFEELGLTQEAIAAYQEAVDADPGFEAAQTSHERLTVSPSDFQNLDRSQVIDATEPPSDTAGRLLRTGTWGGIGPGPDIDRDAKEEPQVTASQKVDAAAEIIIRGDLPTDKGGRR